HGKLVVWPTLRSLATDCGISKSTADRSIDSLVETRHLAPWGGLVPRRENLPSRHSDAYAFTDPPVGYLFARADFDPEDERFHNKALSHPERDNETAKLCPTQGGTMKQGRLSHFQGSFVPFSWVVCPTEMKEVPENPRFASTPTELNTKNRNTTNADSALRAALGGKGVPKTPGHTEIEISAPVDLGTKSESGAPRKLAASAESKKSGKPPFARRAPGAGGGAPAHRLCARGDGLGAWQD